MKPAHILRSTCLVLTSTVFLMAMPTVMCSVSSASSLSFGGITVQIPDGQVKKKKKKTSKSQSKSKSASKPSAAKSKNASPPTTSASPEVAKEASTEQEKLQQTDLASEKDGGATTKDATAGSSTGVPVNLDPSVAAAVVNIDEIYPETKTSVTEESSDTPAVEELPVASAKETSISAPGDDVAAPPPTSTDTSAGNSSTAQGLSSQLPTADVDLLPIEEVLSKFGGEIFKVIPSSSIIAVKVLPQNDQAVENAVEAQVETAVAAAIQKSSAFDARIVPRSTLDAVWTEQSDFGNLQTKDFAAFLKQLSANYIVLVSLRPLPRGTELSAQVVTLEGNDAGSVAYALSPQPIALDTNVVVLTKDDVVQTLRKMAESVEALSNLGGLVAQPKTFSDFYHNARILSQRGEVDLALESYTEVFRSGILFADPVIDVVTLTTRLYGKDGAQVYLDKKLKPLIPQPLYLYAKQLISDDMLPEAMEFISATPAEFPPLVSLVLAKRTQGSNYNKPTWSQKVTMRKALTAIRPQVESGDFLAYYIDQVRAKTDFDRLNSEERGPNELMFIADFTESPVSLHITTYSSIPVQGKMKDLSFDFPYFSDKADISRPFIVCGTDGTSERCVDLLKFACKPGSRSIRVTGEEECVPFEGFGGHDDPITIGPQDGRGLSFKAVLGGDCVSRVVFQDVNGKIVRSSASQMPVSYDMREGLGGQQLRDRIAKCGYKIYERR